VQDTVVLFRRDEELPSGAVVDVRCASDLPLVLIDPQQFRQVLWNLLKNGAEAIAEGGRILVSVDLEPDSGTTVLVAVTDDGHGMADPATVFEPFYTTRAQGTGLGLAVVARIVRDHGGSISAENLTDRGARFVCRLPVAAACNIAPEVVS
jgi:signal transduction histidine kinase